MSKKSKKVNKKKPKILCLGDGLMVDSGFSTTLKAILPYLYNKGMEVRQIAWAYKGYPYNTYPIAQYPILFPNGSYHGYDVLPMVVEEFKPDILFFFGDPYDLIGIKDVDEEVRKQIKRTVAYIPIDSSPIPGEWVKVLEIPDEVITYSKFAQDHLKEKMNRTFPCVYHGYDPKYFYPVDKKKIREEVGLDKYDTIFSCMASNSIRKQIPRLLEAYKLYLEDAKGKSLLYLHMPVREENGWWLDEIMINMGIQDHILFGRGLTPGKGIPMEKVNRIYNIADAIVNPANCFVEGTSVFTEDGYVDIDKIELGQKTLTHEHNLKPITRLFKNEHKGDIITITPRKFSAFSITLTPNHKVFAIKTKGCSRNNKIICKPNCLQNKEGRLCADYHKNYKIEKIEAANLGKDDVVVFPINKEVRAVKPIDLADYVETNRYKIGDKSIVLDKKHRLNRYIIIDNELLRLFGYFVADGNSDVAAFFNFAAHEEDYANDVANIIKSKFGLEAKIYRIKNFIRVVVFSRVVANFFNKTFYKNGEKDKKTFPSWITFLSKEKQEQFIKGLFNGDGHITNKRYCFQFTTTKKDIALMVRDILLRLGIVPSISIVSSKYKVGNDVRISRQYRFALYQNPNSKNFDFFTGIDEYRGAYNEHETKLNVSEYYWFDDNFMYLPITKIEIKEFNGFVYNIEVEDDHSYTIESMLVKNCEGFGLAHLEAAGCARPTMGVDYSSIPELVTNETGWVIPPSDWIWADPYGMKRALIDIPKLSEAMLEVNQNKELAEEKGKAAYQFAKTLTWERQLPLLEAAILGDEFKEFLND